MFTNSYIQVKTFSIIGLITASTHSVKCVQILSYFWSVFSCIRTEYGDYGVNFRIQSEYKKIRTRNNSVFGHFSPSGTETYKPDFYESDI